MAITWTQQNIETYGDAPGDGAYDARYFRLRISHDGLTMGLYDVANDVMMVTRDGGVTWIPAPCPVLLYPGGYFPIFVESVFTGDDGFIGIIGWSPFFYVYNWDTSEWDGYDVGTGTDNFYGIGDSSIDGQYIVIVYDGEYSGGTYVNRGMFLSSDFGKTWARILNTGVSWINCATISTDGRKILASQHTPIPYPSPDTEKIILSTNFGSSFTTVWEEIGPEEDSIMVMDMDDSENNIVGFFRKPINCLISTDGGANWIRKPMIASVSYSDYADGSISRDGTRLIYGNEYEDGAWVSSDLGDTWTEVFPIWPARALDSIWSGAQFKGISNTTIIFVNYDHIDNNPNPETNIYSPLCISYNFGANWTYVAPYEGWQVMAEWSVANNSTGNTLLAATNGYTVNPYMSHNGGTTWVSCNPISGSAGAFEPFYNVAMSTNENYMLLQGSSKVFVSSDSGTSWSEPSLPGISLGLSGMYLSMSSDGRYMAACFDYAYIYYISSNYGVTWQPMSTPVSFTMFAINEDGSLMIGANSTAVYSSTNQGSSFTNITATINSQAGVTIRPTHLEISAEDGGGGSYIYITDSNVGLVYSLTNGATWVKLSPTQYAIIGDYFGAITSSYDGAKLFFSDASLGGRVFISTDYAVSWTSASTLSYNSNNIFVGIDSNQAGDKIIGSTYLYVYLGVYGADNKIKAISGILFANIGKVGGVSIGSLKKISGEEN